MHWSLPLWAWCVLINLFPTQRPQKSSKWSLHAVRIILSSSLFLKKKKERKKVLHSSDSYWILQIENRVPPPYQLQDYPKRSEVYFKMSVTQFDTGTKLFCNHLPNYIPYIMKFLCHKVLCAARQSLLFICMLAENLIQSEFYSFFWQWDCMCNELKTCWYVWLPNRLKKHNY